MPRTTVTPLALAALLAFAAGGRADADRVTIRSVAAPGDRFVRVTVADLTERWKEEDGLVDELTLHRTIDGVVTVAPASRGAERITVEFPRASAVTAVTHGGKLLDEPVTFLSPMHGSTLRYERASSDWSASVVAGPTPELLLRFLTTPQADPLRRTLVPQGECAVGAVAATDAAGALRPLADEAPVRITAVDSLSLHVANADADVVRFAGIAKCRAVVRVPTFGETDATFDVEIAETVGRSDGLLRTLSLSGESSVDVKRSPRSTHAEISFECVETTTRPAPGSKYERPAGSWKPLAVLVPALDDRSWYVAHHRMDPATGGAITEWLVEGEKVIDGSEKGWTEMVRTQRCPRTADAATAASFGERFRTNMARDIPSAKWTTLPAAKGEFVYEWTLPGDAAHPAQHEIGRVLASGGAILHVAYVKKVPQMTPADRAAWLERISRATIAGAD